MKLLAIGGPKSFKWLPDSGSQLVVAISKPLNVHAYTDKFNPLSDTPAIETHTYIKHRITNFENETYKDVYVSQELANYEADRMLRQWLLDQFVAMDTSDDSD